MLSILSLTAACGTNESSDTQAGPSSAPAGSALEQAALDAGVVANVEALSPVGLYRKRHEAGRDSLCIVNGKDGKLDFALEAVFGENMECHGQGTLRISGDKLILNFARSACLVVASYEGDRVALPGALDVECNALCTQRGSLEGVSFPRVSREENVARAAQTNKGGVLCPQIS